jgi:hypothetical protein
MSPDFKLMVPEVPEVLLDPVVIEIDPLVAVFVSLIILGVNSTIDPLDPVLLDPLSTRTVPPARLDEYPPSIFMDPPGVSPTPIPPEREIFPADVPDDCPPLI